MDILGGLVPPFFCPNVGLRVSCKASCSARCVLTPDQDKALRDNVRRKLHLYSIASGSPAVYLARHGQSPVLRLLAGLVALMLLLVVGLGPVGAQSTDALQTRQEETKQDAIYQLKGEDTPEGYVIDRSLIAYTFTLPAAFDRSLASLGTGDRWLDIGAGKGQAVLDYYGERYDAMHAAGRDQRGKKARAVAISIEDRRDSLWARTAANLEPNQIQYMWGRRLRQYSPGELGKFDLITDVLGGFSYTENLSLFMEKVLGLLNLNGSFYTVLQDVHSDGVDNKPYYPGERYLTEISDDGAGEIKVCRWLKRISCVEVTCEFRADWKPQIEAYRVHKLCNETTVPALQLTFFEAGTPPERRFQSKAESTAVPDSPVSDRLEK